MQEYIFGPSADWLPLTIKEGEAIQPRLDGGYDYPSLKKFGSYIINAKVSEVVDYGHPTLFDMLDERDEDNLVTGEEENEY